MPRALAITGRLIRVLASLTTLAGFTAGVPCLLAVTAGWPLGWTGWSRPADPPALADVLTALTSPWSESQLLAPLAAVGWLLWLQFCRDLTIEIILAVQDRAAIRRGDHRPRDRSRGPLRLLAAVLVGSIATTALASAVHANGSRPVAAGQLTAADLEAQNLPVVTTGVETGVPTLATVDVEATATGTRHGEETDPGIPDWAQNAPGGTYRVVKDDNLWNIAKAQLGDPNRWREIYVLNRGQRQLNGYCLTDPDLIDIGWVLVLPVSGRDGGQPSVPSVTESPETPGTPDKHANAGEPDPTPAATETASAGETSPSPETSPTAEAETDVDQEDQAAYGMDLPSGGWISLGLAAAIAAVASLLRLRERRRTRLTFPSPATADPSPSPVPADLAIVETSTGATVAAPIGVDSHGREASVFTLPGPGIGVSGSGALGAVRGILASALATGADTSPYHRPIVVTSTSVLGRLLPSGAAPVGLDPDGVTFDGERLMVLPEATGAIARAEEEMIHRQRLLDQWDLDTVDQINDHPDAIEFQPEFVLLIEADRRHANRILALGAQRAALHIHPVVLGDQPELPTAEVSEEGMSPSTPTGLIRWSVLSASDLAHTLAMIADTAPRPEAGLESEDSPSRGPLPQELAGPDIPAPGETTPPVRLRVLGSVTLATESGTPVSTGMRSGSYALLAALAAHPEGRTAEQLAILLLPNVETSAAIKRVRTDITTTRRVLRAATGIDHAMFILNDLTTGRYRIDPMLIDVDLWRMLDSLRRANIAEDEQGCLTALREATTAYGGEFAAGQDRGWAADHATSYRNQILAAHARIAEILETDQPDQAIAALEQATDIDPVNEDLYQRIMRIQGRLCRPDSVRRTLRHLEDRLADLCDGEPTEATRRVAHRQLRPVGESAVSGGRR